MAIVVALLIVVAIALPFLVNINNFRPQIESNLSSVLGRPVKVGNLSLGIFSGSVGADQLSIADDPKFSSAPFIQAKTFRVGVELMPLIFSKQLNVTNILIDHPEITLLRDRDGIWNFSSLGNQPTKQPAQPAKTTEKTSGSASANVSVAKLNLKDGTVTVGSMTGKRKPIVYDKVNVTMRNFSFTSVFPVTASVELPGGGSLKIDGTAGPINATDTSLTPVQAKVTLGKLDLAQSAVVDPELGIAGSADFEGTLTSDGSIAKANGTLKATSLKLVPKGSPAGVPVQVVFEVEHDLKNESGKLVRGDVSIGKALAQLTGTYNMHGETTSIQTTLNGQAMPVDDLEAMLPALGVILPTDKHALAMLQARPTIPLPKLLDQRGAFTRSEQDTELFYQQSWALTHFLTLGPGMEGGDRLKKFFNAAQLGVEQKKAFQDTFGDFKHVQQDFDQYIRLFAFHAAVIPRKHRPAWGRCASRTRVTAFLRSTHPPEPGSGAVRRNPDDIR